MKAMPRVLGGGDGKSDEVGATWPEWDGNFIGFNGCRIHITVGDVNGLVIKHGSSQIVLSESEFEV